MRIAIAAERFKPGNCVIHFAPEYVFRNMLQM